MIDLRSDTVTRPTAEMYAAMAAAELGDNVLETDPTVGALEEMTASLTGHEAALFMPSGTMCNQAAIAAHTRPGDAILCEDQAHISWYEGGGPAVFAGVVVRGIPAEGGILAPHHLEAHAWQRSLHTPATALICIENTHNRHGGSVWPLEALAAMAGECGRRGLPLHMDGARVWNASAALGVEPVEITSLASTVSVCLSKGLGAPVGSVLCGPRAFIEEAAYWRKRLGGGMRQAGILAACGLVALTRIDRLVDDHLRAREMAALASDLPGLDARVCATNIVILETGKPAAAWQEALASRGVACLPFGPNLLRLVYHADIDEAAHRRALNALHQTAEALAGT
jgi:threonine aldolase